MHFIERDIEGQLVRVEFTPFPESTEQCNDATAEIEEWLKSDVLRSATLQQLQQSDLDMVRVLEDLIELLMSKGIIRFTNLPIAAQNKLLSRAKARQALSGLEDLIGDEEKLI